MSGALSVSINVHYYYQACPHSSLDYRYQRNSGKGRESVLGMGGLEDGTFWKHALQTVLTLCYFSQNNADDLVTRQNPKAFHPL